MASTKPTYVTTYAITATYATTKTDAHGSTYSGSRSVPTFYLNSRVQGITDVAHAQAIAADILTCGGAHKDLQCLTITAVAVDPAEEAVDALLARAAELGSEHGRNAASRVIDGNTSAGSCRAIVRGLDDGDPAVYDQFRTPNLSGEYTDDMTPAKLMGDLGSAVDAYSELGTEVCNAYEEGASAAFWSEVERIVTPEPSGYVNCPCCGDVTIGPRGERCQDCAAADCGATRDATGELGYWSCDRDDAYADGAA